MGNIVDKLKMLPKEQIEDTFHSGNEWDNVNQGRRINQTEDSEKYIYYCGVILLIAGLIAYVLNLK